MVFVWDKLNGAVIFFQIGGHEKSGGHIIFSWKVGGHKSDWVATNFTELGFPDQQKPWLFPLINVNILIFSEIAWIYNVYERTLAFTMFTLSFCCVKNN